MNHQDIRSAVLRTTVCTFLLLTFAAPRADAGAAAWTRTGPLQGGVVTALAVDPTDPSRVYLGTRSNVEQSGVFRSGDGGETWTHVGPDGLRAVTRLAVHPRRGSTVYAVGIGLGGWALYRSRDAGATWALLRLPRGLSDGADLALDPAHPARLIAYAASYCEPHCDDHYSLIFESADGGESWSLLRRLPAYLETLEIDPLDPSVLYAATAGSGTALSGVIKSSDGGRSWREVGGGRFAGGSVPELAVDPVNAGTVYASTWNPGRFDGNDGDFLKSVDGGDSWRSIRRGMGDAVVSALVFSPSDPAVLYAGTWSGVFVSADGGRRWRPSFRGLSNSRVEALAVDPRSPSVLYAGTAGDGVFKSVDGGARWTPKRRKIELPVVASLAVGPGSPSVLFAGTEADFVTGGGSGIYRSVDGARSWQPVNRGLPVPRGRIAAVAVDPGDPAIVYAAPARQGLYKSVDQGSSWAAADDGLDLEDAGFEKTVLDLAIDPRRSTTLYAATYFGVYKSNDGAGSWRRASAGLAWIPYTRAVAVDPRHPATVYASASNRVYRSGDGAATWTATGPRGVREVFDLAIDASGTVYVGTDDGVLRSADGGLTWTPSGLPGNGGVRRLEILPGSPGVVYAAVTYAGVFRSTDGGESWTVLDAASPQALVTVIAVAADGPVKVFAGFLNTVGVYEWEE